MKKSVTIGIIGDYDEKKTSHPATNSAIRHAADYLSLKADVTWLPTPSFLKKGGLPELDGVWASSGSPYRSLEGALNAIRAARKAGRPFIGT
jgi:CTP synthase (UTP-ammonia lyase)